MISWEELVVFGFVFWLVINFKEMFFVEVVIVIISLKWKNIIGV